MCVLLLGPGGLPQCYCSVVLVVANAVPFTRINYYSMFTYLLPLSDLE